METNRVHLNALELRLSNERNRLALATIEQERQLRSIWISQIEKEIQGEREFTESVDISDDDLLSELLG